MKTHLKKGSILLSLLTVLLIGGCSGSDGKDGIDGTTTVINEDKSPPVALSTQPMAAATAIAPNTAFNIIMSEAIDIESVTSSMVMLTGPEGAVSGSVATSTNTITFTPQNPLTAESSYTLTLLSGVKDLSGNTLSTDSSWNFMTGTTPDTIPPSIATVTPVDGSSDIDEQSIITVTFDEAMDAATLNAASFRLQKNGTQLSGTVQSSGNSAVFIPTVALEQGTLYSVIVTDNAKDLAGNPIAADYSWSFTTQSEEDLTPPTVVLTDPQDGHKVPYLTSQVSAYFSEEMDAASINTDTFILENTRGKVAGNINYSNNKATLNITDPRLDLNSRYSATITDFVKDSNGLRMAQEHQWEFITLDGSWQGAALIESDTGTTTYPQVAVDTSGNAVAVWLQYDGTRNNIWANRFDVLSGSWQGATLIESDTGDASSPQVAVDDSGNAMAVWYQSDGSDYSIYANHFDALSSSWQGAALIESGTGRAYSPQVAVDTNGNAIAIWYQYDGTYSNIYTNRFDVLSGSWQGAVLIENDNTDSAYNPQVVIDTNGNAMAIWYQSDGTRNNILANRFHVLSGSWQGATLIESGTGNAYNPQIAVDDSGNAMAIWYQSDGTRNNIWANHFDVLSGSWQGAALIESDTGDASSPQVAVDDSGNAMAVWYQSDGSAYSIYANHFDALSGSWQGAALIENNTGYADLPQVAVDASGNAIAVWRQYDGTPSNIYTNRFDVLSGSWQEAALIENDTGNAYSHQVAVGANGNAIAVWYQYDGTYFNIYANRFE